MSQPMPLTSKHNRQIWRETFLSDKAHPEACQGFTCRHARDFVLLCLDELDKIYAVSEAQNRLIEALGLLDADILTEIRRKESGAVVMPVVLTREQFAIVNAINDARAELAKLTGGE